VFLAPSVCVREDSGARFAAAAAAAAAAAEAVAAGAPEACSFFNLRQQRVHGVRGGAPF